MTQPQLDHFEQLLEYLQESRGFDGSAYKRPSLERRMRKRVEAVGVTTFEEYLDYLQVHPDEFSALFNTVLINVTGFFRDADAWAYLQSAALPRILADRKSGDPLRVWSAGCASGQEAYTILMVLAELMGSEAVRDEVKVYGTDADEEALNEARAATYSAKQVEDVPPALLEKYFDQTGASYVFKRELRRSVIFGKHDLLQDAPISRIDLLLCRNTLMYFNPEAQARILSRFYFSLKPGAHIFLGRAEMLFSHGAMFAPVDLKHRLYRVVGKRHQRERALLLGQTGLGEAAAPLRARLRDAAFEETRAPQIIVERTGVLVSANAPARHRFGINVGDMGRRFQDLDVSYRPTELRAAMSQAVEGRFEVAIRDVESIVGSDKRIYDVAVVPLLDEDQSVIGTRITYEDVTELRSLQTQLQQSRHDLETAYEELQSTNEELETTNEELQSTVEELETTNEELQSTNEELETMNEELQSTNEELHSRNDELRSRSTELNAANAYLESVFASLRSAVIVIDKDFRIDVWNEKSADLWGLRPDEVQRAHLLDLDIGLALADLRQPIREVLSGAAESRELLLAGTNRRGKAISCRVSIGPLRQLDRSIGGVILLIEEQSVPDGVRS
jgi:two-component system CheB/CheR fusion protein